MAPKAEYSAMRWRTTAALASMVGVLEWSMLAGGVRRSSETPWVIQARTRWRVGRGRGDAESRSMRSMVVCHARCSESPKMEARVRLSGGGEGGTSLGCECPATGCDCLAVTCGGAIARGCGGVMGGAESTGGVAEFCVVPGRGRRGRQVSFSSAAAFRFFAEEGAPRCPSPFITRSSGWRV